jgi:hypothetical protein
MFHVVSWGQNVDPGGAMVALNAIREAALFTLGTFHKVHPRMPYLIGTSALINDASASRAQFRSPSLVADGGYDIEPIVTAGTFGTPPEVRLFPDSPLWLEPDEQLEAFVESTPVGAKRHFAHAWLADGISTPIFEEVFTVRCSAAIQQVDFTWTSGNITFEQSLPQGRYLVVGMRCRASNGQIARLIFRDQLGRPGCPIVSGVFEPDLETYRYGNMGVWGHFRQEDPPVLEIFHGTANSQALILDLVRF